MTGPRANKGRPLQDKDERYQWFWHELSEAERGRWLEMLGWDRYAWVTDGHTPCECCIGTGLFTYADTRTWHAPGYAGQAMTTDVCDACWGSGRHGAPWPAFPTRPRP